MKKLLNSVKDLWELSKLTKTKNKKIRIILGAILSNLIVLFDIVIITTVTSIFSENEYINNWVVDYFVKNKAILPFVVILRFSSIYFENLLLMSICVFQTYFIIYPVCKFSIKD